MAITVASVGPYVFTTRARPAHRLARPAVSHSAPSTHLCTPGTVSGSSTPNSDGTTLAVSTP
ncbi:hypothetical protein ACFV7R_47130, partial [Streptomyces sp. NPDC059866]|uniref:hypothetical protein n=1 Tax=Streptomyces sp. NPDC059866 TaxID=3346978 RepID=UPI00366886D2